jgi:hypothetical protein
MSNDPLWAHQIEARETEWLLPDVLPGRLPLGRLIAIAGRPDVGKSLLTYWLAAQVTREGVVLFSSPEEDKYEDFKPKADIAIEAAGGDLSKVMFWRFRLPHDEKELARRVRQHKPALIVMDPLSEHLSGIRKLDADRVREEVLAPLRDLIRETRTTVVICDHTLKGINRTADPMMAIGGSLSGLVGVARVAYLFGRHPDEEDVCVLSCVKPGPVGRRGVGNTFTLDWARHKVNQTCPISRSQARSRTFPASAW